MREPVKDPARLENITPTLSVGVYSLSHRIGAKGTVHLSHTFRGRESGDFPRNVATKGEKRRTDTFRDLPHGAMTAAVISRQRPAG